MTSLRTLSLSLVLLAGPAGVARAAGWGIPVAPQPLLGDQPLTDGGNAPSAVPVPVPAPPPVVQEPPAAPPAMAAPADAFPSAPAAPPEPAADVATAFPSAPPSRRTDRPRFQAAVAMGASIDSSWAMSSKTFVSPTFAATVGFGDGPVGVDVRLLSSQATGRGSDAGPDRVSLDLMVALRPWASRVGLDPRWGRRVLRALTIDLGLAAERISAGAASDLRGGVVAGVHADLPLTAAAATDGELRLRVAVRRMLGGDGAVGNTKAGDSTECLGGLVVAF